MRGILLSVLFLTVSSGLSWGADQPAPAQPARDVAQLTAKIADLSKDREAILNRFKVITKENSDLKDQLSDLEQNLSQMTTANKQMNEQLLKTQKENNDLLKQKTGVLTPSCNEKDLRKLIVENANIHYNLGVMLQWQNKYEAAIREFNMAIKENPNDAEANYNLAIIYDSHIKDGAKALEHYKRYIQLIPTAVDLLRVKERINNLSLEQKVWGNPDETHIGKKEKADIW